MRPAVAEKQGHGLRPSQAPAVTDDAGPEFGDEQSCAAAHDRSYVLLLVMCSQRLCGRFPLSARNHEASYST